MTRNRYIQATLTALVLLLTALILTDLWPNLRGPAPNTAEWHWPYGLRPFSRWWLPIVAAVLLSGITAWWLRTRRWQLALAALVLGNLLLQGALVYTAKPAIFTELIERSLADETNGYFRLAATTPDMAALLHDYPALMPSFPSEHTRTHPPGLVLANWVALQTFQRLPNLSQTIAEAIWPRRCTDLWLLDSPPAVAAALAAVTLLTTLAGALTILPTYALARHLLPDKAARLAAALTATLPALLIFTPTPLQVDALLAITAVWLLQVGLERKKYGWFLLSGLLVSMMTFFSLGNAVLLPLLAGYAAWGWWQRRAERPFPQLIMQLAMVGLGAATVWLVYWAAAGVPPWRIAQVGLGQHYELVTLHRRYAWWLAYNWLDLLLFAGPVVVIGFFAIFRKPLALLRVPYAALVLPLLLLLLLLDFSGSARGEVGRLWLFLMPFLTIGSAAFYLKDAATASPSRLIMLQLLLALAIGLAWRPIEAVIVVAERPSLPANPTPQTERDAAFYYGDNTAMTLRGYDIAQTADFLELTLYWQAEQPATRPFTVFTHLLNQQGELVAQQDNWPVNGRWPPTCWQNGDIITDAYRLPLTSLPAGNYDLLIGWYDARDNTRLHLSDGQDALRLTTIQR
ncbi:MAG: glycosyltransferase family 39 protein [Anaerolineales bacterium]|nr:glycosyltransferase family 39 protein [Anaerolineales bacterium]